MKKYILFLFLSVTAIANIGPFPGGSSGGGGSGTVTSVGLADASGAPIYTVSGSPVTTSGTLTLTLSTETANKVFAGPTTGSAAQPTFRTLVAADIPSLSYVNAISAFGSAPNANGGSISGSTLTLQPAASGFPGGVSIDAQSFSGNKTFESNILVNGINKIGGSTAIVDIDNQALTNSDNTDQLLWDGTGVTIPSLTAGNVVSDSGGHLSVTAVAPRSITATGLFQCNGATPVTVSDAAITGESLVLLTSQIPSGTQVGIAYMTDQNAGSFNAACAIGDNSYIAYAITTYSASLCEPTPWNCGIVGAGGINCTTTFPLNANSYCTSLCLLFASDNSC